MPYHPRHKKNKCGRPENESSAPNDPKRATFSTVKKKGGVTSSGLGARKSKLDTRNAKRNFKHTISWHFEVGSWALRITED